MGSNGAAVPDAAALSEGRSGESPRKRLRDDGSEAPGSDLPPRQRPRTIALLDSDSDVATSDNDGSYDGGNGGDDGESGDSENDMDDEVDGNDGAGSEGSPGSVEAGELEGLQEDSVVDAGALRERSGQAVGESVSAEGIADGAVPQRDYEGPPNGDDDAKGEGAEDGLVRRSTRVRRPVGTTKPDAQDGEGGVVPSAAPAGAAGECVCDDVDGTLCRMCGNCPVCCICTDGFVLATVPIVPSSRAASSADGPVIRSRSQRRRDKERIEHGVAGHLDLARSVLQADFTRDIRKVCDIYRVILAQAAKNLTSQQNEAHNGGGGGALARSLGVDPLPPTAVRDALLRCMDFAKAAIMRDYKGTRVPKPESRDSVEPRELGALGRPPRRDAPSASGFDDGSSPRDTPGVEDSFDSGRRSRARRPAADSDVDGDAEGDDDESDRESDAESAAGESTPAAASTAVPLDESPPSPPGFFPRHLMIRGKYGVTPVNPQSIDAKTEFLLGAHVNVYLLAAGKGRLYSRHPNLYMFSPNNDEKRLLQSMDVIQNTGSKATLLLRSQIIEIVGHYKPYRRYRKEIAALKTFTLPRSMLSRARNASKIKK